MISPHGLKKLDALVRRACEQLKTLSEKNEKLASANSKFEAENNRLKEDVKRLSESALKRRLLRRRIERLSDKIGRIEAFKEAAQ
jgi:predicted RNase H-like nuclease (RuvC/YqgF family)